MKTAVIGAGSWGTTVAVLSARGGSDTVLWARRPELAAAMAETRRNPDYLPDLELPAGVMPTADVADVSGSELVFVALPSHGFRNVLTEATGAIDSSATLVSLTKGIEQGTLLRMTEIAQQILARHPHGRIGVLTGPNLAAEIGAGQPAATVVAMTDQSAAQAVQGLLMSPTFRVYTNPDVVGCEAAGAVKNVMAIAAGMAAGLGYGDNTMAALITRALAELSRLGVALGGSPLTFAGLAGMGDLIATCTSVRSRNHRVGVELGKGRSLVEITAEMRMVAEGVKTSKAVLELAVRHQVDMPIAVEVGRVLYEGKPPSAAVADLMKRGAKAELEGLEL